MFVQLCVCFVWIFFPSQRVSSVTSHHPILLEPQTGTKVTKSDVSISCQQDVVRFDVSVEETSDFNNQMEHIIRRLFSVFSIHVTVKGRFLW